MFSVTFEFPLGCKVMVDAAMNDGGRDEAQARRPEALVLKGSVSDFTLAMEEHRPPERVAGLALVEAGVAALKVPMVAMVSISVLVGPPIGLDGTMTGREPGAGHRLRPQRNGGPKSAVIGPGSRQSCP